MLEMRNIALTEDKKRQVLGGEVAMWTAKVKLILVVYFKGYKLAH